MARALKILNGLPNLTAYHTPKAHVLGVNYNLRDYTLSGLEQALALEGFLLDRSFFHQVGRNVIHYCEDTTRHNMEIRGHLTKKNEKEVFVGLSGHHHSHAIKPPEQREYE